MEAQQAQSDWLLEQFDNNYAPDGTKEYQGTNYPGHPDYGRPNPFEPQTHLHRLMERYERQIVEQARFRASRNVPLSRWDGRFNFAVAQAPVWHLTEDEERQISLPTHDIVEVHTEREMRYPFCVRFYCYYRGQRYDYVVDTNLLEQYTEDQIKRLVTDNFIRMIYAERQRIEGTPSLADGLR